MVDDRKDEPTQTTDKGREIPIPTRGDWDKTVGKIVNRRVGLRDGPPEIEDAARQEAEYPADETDEG